MPENLLVARGITDGFPGPRDGGLAACPEPLWGAVGKRKVK